ncbi:MAG: Gfo/Idh/MocA family oxidoreductase [Opitutaceae bacterium]|nr:Gfo/Idh/MocA family oxidoreductase [Opitutaceae bacterium]
MKSKLNIGLVGAGRMGIAYARYLANRVPGATLYAVSDVRLEAAKAAASECGTGKAYEDFHDLLADQTVDAVVVMTPTKLHKDVVVAAARAGKPIFCEKPLALTVEDANAIKDAVAVTGVFFQLGFMRRFDAGYAAAKSKINAGAIGKPCVFKSTSKDKERPSVDYLRPENSGGLFIDMGIHDFDLARWFMGDVASVYSTGGVLAYPEMKGIGDWDNALTNLRFTNGCIGMVSLSRNGVYGYGIYTEIVGTEGTIQIGYDRETPVLVMKKDSIAHDTVPGFYERFENAYIAQLQNFVQNLLHDRPAPITVDDGIAAQKIALAATKSAQEDGVVKLDSPGH